MDAVMNWFGTPVGSAVVKVLVVGNVVPLLVSFLVWLERRVAAWIQDRTGPNRVGPFGLLQSFADLLKFIFKEDVLPGHVNKPMYLLAPALAVIPPLVALAVIPFADRMMIADLDTGVLAVFAFSSIGVYALALGGWASNSKYALIGGVRASAQLISYELVLGLAALGVFMITGSLRLHDVVTDQANGLLIDGTLRDGFLPKFFDWNIWKQPLGALLFFIAALAETNRAPFDLPEAESELAAGYHTEYSSMKFALFFLGEYAAMVAISGLFTTLYLGGWTLFGAENLFAGTPALQTAWQIAIFTGKVVFLLFTIIWIRWTVPRFRYDQLMDLGWKRMLPISIGWLVFTALATWAYAQHVR
ncbi:MAG: NADH-quinone oxidoreductase subunit H [Planctomycetes bacterium]|nr:NADH-quinone oxidoreductase subunit H [Planctomycetota bacterium]